MTDKSEAISKIRRISAELSDAVFDAEMAGAITTEEMNTYAVLSQQWLELLRRALSRQVDEIRSRAR